VDTAKVGSRTYRLDELPQTAEWILNTCAGERIFLMDAPMGGGKTTLVKGLIGRLSDQSFLGSPTFSLVHEYAGHEGEPVYHFDLYRLKDARELLDMGFEEYIDRGGYLFIEWPEKALPFLDRYCHVRIEPVDEITRQIILEKHSL